MIERPGNHGRRLLYLKGDPAEFEEFVAAYRDHESTESFRRVSGTDGEEAYFTTEIAYDDANPSVLSILNANDVFTHGATVVQGGIEHWLGYVQEKAALQDVISELESYDNDFVLYRCVEIREAARLKTPGFSQLLQQLTTRQRTTFRTALKLGYYDGETEVTVRDIAAELDLHATTAWEHIKKAENTVLTEVGTRLLPTLDLEEAEMRSTGFEQP